MAKARSSLWLFLIAIFRLMKGVALLIAGFGLLRLLHRDVAAAVTHWVEVLRVDPDNRYVHKLLLKVFAVKPGQLRALSVGTFIYAGLFLTEGTALLLRKRWAEYMTAISTALFIPLEVYEIWHHFTWLRVAIAVVNVLIVIYLVRHIRGKN